MTKKSQKVETEENIEVETKDIKKAKKVKKEKKPMTKWERRKLFLQIAGWIMTLVMVFGVLMTFLMYFVS